MHTKVDANSNDLNRSRFSLRNRLDRFQTRLDGFSVCIRAFTFTFNLSAEALRQICRLSFVLPSKCSGHILGYIYLGLTLAPFTHRGYDFIANAYIYILYSCL